MKKQLFIFQFFLIYSLVIVFTHLSTICAFSADLDITDIKIVDVTPFEFSISWHASLTKTLDISVFSDSLSQTNITDDIRTYLFPVSHRINRDSLWPMKARISGCQPDTPYYITLSLEDNPFETHLDVKTTKENAFVLEAKQLLLEFPQNDMFTDLSGCMVIAKKNETLFPISTYVQSNLSSNHAFIDLSNLFGLNSQNWTPKETKEIDIHIYGLGKNPIRKKIPVEFTDYFIISQVKNNNNNKISIQEAIYVLERVSMVDEITR